MSGELPIDSGNPFQSPATTRSEAGETSPYRPSRFGDYMNRAFSAYTAHWSEWLLPILLAGVIALLAYFACVFPFLLAQGPLMCGLFACAFRSLRGGPVEISTLGRGWELFGRAILASFVLFLIQLIPVAIIGSVIVAAIGLFASIAGPNPRPDEATVAVLVVSGAVCYMALIFGLMLWSLWIGTRTMFIWPLIADRGYGFFAAWNESWESTKVRFWELLLLNFLAGLIASLGIYACYIGVILTLPLYFLIVAAVYEDRFGIASA